MFNRLSDELGKTISTNSRRLGVNCVHPVMLCRADASLNNLVYSRPHAVSHCPRSQNGSLRARSTTRHYHAWKGESAMLIFGGKREQGLRECIYEYISLYSCKKREWQFTESQRPSGHHLYIYKYNISVYREWRLRDWWWRQKSKKKFQLLCRSCQLWGQCYFHWFENSPEWLLVH
jgi:hypothetical protein